MHISGLPPWIAPVSTGHPLGLPPTHTKTDQTSRVKPVQDAKSADHNADTAFAGHNPPLHPPDPAAEPDPATHVAPPSIMQLKITKMLDEQAAQTSDAAEELPQIAAPDDAEPTDAAHNETPHSAPQLAIVASATDSVATPELEATSDLAADPEIADALPSEKSAE